MRVGERARARGRRGPAEERERERAHARAGRKGEGEPRAPHLVKIAEANPGARNSRDKLPVLVGVGGVELFKHTFPVME